MSRDNNFAQYLKSIQTNNVCVVALLLYNDYGVM